MLTYSHFFFYLENGCNDHFEPIGSKWCIRSFAYPKSYHDAKTSCESIGAGLIPVISSEMNVISCSRNLFSKL